MYLHKFLFILIIISDFSILLIVKLLKYFEEATVVFRHISPKTINFFLRLYLYLDVSFFQLEDMEVENSSEHVPFKAINIDLSQPAHNVPNAFNKLVHVTLLLFYHIFYCCGKYYFAEIMAFIDAQ